MGDKYFQKNWLEVFDVLTLKPEDCMKFCDDICFKMPGTLDTVNKIFYLFDYSFFLLLVLHI